MASTAPTSLAHHRIGGAELRYSARWVSWGPHSDSVIAAIDALGAMEWFVHVGEPLSDPRIARVTTWQQALEIFELPNVYDRDGYPHGISEEIAIVSNDPELRHWYRGARDTAEDYCDFMPFIPRALTTIERGQVSGYLSMFVSLLIAEIIGADRLTSTYARDQLGWYVLGRLPCGHTPDGRGRIF
jgi:hypothetical protein